MTENIYKTIQYQVSQAGFKWQHTIEELEKVFKQNSNGMNWSTFISGCIDTVLRHTWNRCVDTMDYPSVCIVAIGGYGRGECVPYSDIDLVFLYDDTQTTDGMNQFENLVQNMVRTLWDMGFKLGQSMHTPHSLIAMAEQDIIQQTALLTHRYIIGDYTVYQTLLQNMPQTRSVHKITNFMRKKQQEQQKRHKKFGDNQYILEPNIKQSRGGIRDLDTVYWICIYTFANIRTIYDLATHSTVAKRHLDDFNDCMQFFNRVRTCMHLIDKKASDILYFDMQKQVADRMGYLDVGQGDLRGVEVFMGDYYRYVSKSEITATALLQTVHHFISPQVHMNLPASVTQKYPLLSAKTHLQSNQLYMDDISICTDNPHILIMLFEMAQHYKYDIHPTTIIRIQQFLEKKSIHISTNPIANTAFLNILQGENAYKMLHYMNISGVLSCVLPEWKNIYCQMQYDMYHDYTTDAHTIHALQHMQEIQSGMHVSDLPVITRLSQTIQKSKSRNVILLVAILLHDIAKGLGGNHSELGADIAKTVCQRMGLGDLATDTVQWLVRHHLLLSHTADRRDITDLKTLHDFTKTVHSTYLLDLLVILTTVDVRSVGKNIWTPWKHSLIMKVYTRAKAHLVGNTTHIPHHDAIYNITHRLCHLDNINAIVTHLTSGYLESTPDDMIDWHLSNIAQNPQGGIYIKQDTQNNHTQIMVHTSDTIGMTASITSALTHMQMNIIGADIYTFYKLGSLYTYRVESVNGYTEQQVRHRMQTALSSHTIPSPQRTILRPRHQSFQVQSQVIIDNHISYNTTMIEIHTRNRHGVLSVITKTLSDLNINIHSARITSYGEWVCDVFYVQDKYGFKLYQQQAKNRVQHSLYTALENWNAK